MELLIFIAIVVLIVLAIYFIGADLLSVPYVKTSKALTILNRRYAKSAISNIEVVLDEFCNFVAKFIRIDEYQRDDLNVSLRIAGINCSPEHYKAKVYVKAFLVSLLAIPAYLIFPILVLPVAAIAIILVLKQQEDLDKLIAKKRAEIEAELPRFSNTTEKLLNSGAGVLGILEYYKETAGKTFGSELDITIADIRTGNEEAALVRLESRISSTSLSDVVRGLIGVSRGEDTHFYWQNLNVKLADLQRQSLKAEAVKVPGKVKRLSFLLMISFISVYLLALGMEIISALVTMF